MELFFDTETSDMYKFNKPHDDPSQPWIVQLGFILSTRDAIYQEGNFLIRADGRKIEPGAEAIHCISSEISEEIGMDEKLVLELFANLILLSDTLIAHNIQFDAKVLLASVSDRYDEALLNRLKNRKGQFCTMLAGTNICKLPGRFGKYKWPKLQELHIHLFGEEFIDAHDALADVRATRRCYYEMTKLPE